MWVKLIFIGIIAVIVAFKDAVYIFYHNYFDGTITNCAKHELPKGMDDVLFEEMFNDFQEHDNIPLACNSLPNKSDSTTACSITTASDSPLN
jgi:muramidase (phage lysozyme)